MCKMRVLRACHVDILNKCVCECCFRGCRFVQSIIVNWRLPSGFATQLEHLLWPREDWGQRLEVSSCLEAHRSSWVLGGAIQNVCDNSSCMIWILAVRSDRMDSHFRNNQNWLRIQDRYKQVCEQEFLRDCPYKSALRLCVLGVTKGPS